MRMWTIIAVSLVPIVLFGCRLERQLSVVEDSDPFHPTFCISRRPSECVEQDTPYPDLVFTEVDDSGNAIRDVWMIVPDQTLSIGEIEYGVTPAGWKSLVEVKPFRQGNWYRANDHYFRVVSKDHLVELEFLDSKAFWREVRNSQTQ